ncbi:hypothetical protein FACS189413_17650 [Bacteroidia bacterium]|nr:hypothetical protein FACS189413_17650 [Bacteroidia bacterium]
MPSPKNIEQNKPPEKPNQFIIFKTEDAQISVDVRFDLYDKKRKYRTI